MKYGLTFALAAISLCTTAALAQMPLPAGVPKFSPISPAFDGVAKNGIVLLHVDGEGCTVCATQKTALDQAYNDIKYIRVQTFHADATKDAAAITPYSVTPGDVILIKQGKVIEKTSGETSAAAFKMMLEKGIAQ